MTRASPGQGGALTALNKTLALTGPWPSEAMGSGSLVGSEMLGSLFTPSSSSGWEGAMAGTCHSQGVLRLCWCGSQWPRLSLWHLGTTHIPAGVAMPGWVCGAAGWAWGEFRRGSGPAHRHACLYLLPYTCTQVHVCPLCLKRPPSLTWSLLHHLRVPTQCRPARGASPALLPHTPPAPCFPLPPGPLAPSTRSASSAPVHTGSPTGQCSPPAPAFRAGPSRLLVFSDLVGGLN